MDFLDRGEFELLTYEERMNILYNFHTLEGKGLYPDPDFWSKLTTRINSDRDLGDLPPISSDMIYDMVNFCLQLGSNLMTVEERFFDYYGCHYDDYAVPPYEDYGGTLSEGEYSDDEY
jgi:hypothetical protein